MMRGKEGLSMLEILVCMMIVTIMATGVAAVNSFPRRAALTLEDRMKASLAMERKLDELRGQDVTSLTDGTKTETVPSLTGGTLTYVITTPDVARPDWKEVYVSIEWTGRRGSKLTQDAISSLYNG